MEDFGKRSPWPEVRRGSLQLGSLGRANPRRRCGLAEMVADENPRRPTGRRPMPWRSGSDCPASSISAVLGISMLHRLLLLRLSPLHPISPLMYHLGDDKPPFSAMKPCRCPIAFLGHYFFIAFSDLEVVIPMARPRCDDLLS